MYVGDDGEKEVDGSLGGDELVGEGMVKRNTDLKRLRDEGGRRWCKRRITARLVLHTEICSLVV